MDPVEYLAEPSDDYETVQNQWADLLYPEEVS